VSAHNGIKVAISGAILYVVLAFACVMSDDRDHAAMFLVGSIIWVLAILIWTRTQKDEE
jgi:hypothetical protein